jgi:hypothetical protein
MAEITLTVPNEKVPVIVEAFRAIFQDIDKNLTDAQFAKEVYRRFTVNLCADYYKDKQRNILQRQMDAISSVPDDTLVL